MQYVTDVDEKKIDHFSLKKGDILFSHINSDLHLGKTAVFQSDKPLLHGINLLLIRTKSNLLDPKYLHYILNLYRASGLFMAIAQHAVNQSSLNQTKIKSLKIPLPPRIEDQQQIVAEIEMQLSRLDEAVTAMKRIQANLKRYKAAVLKAAVEGKFTEQWRKEHPDVEPAGQLFKRILAERRAKWEAEELAKMKAKGIKPKDDSWKKKYKEPAEPDTANLPELPEGWVWATIDAMAFVTKLAGFEYTKYVKYDPEGDLAVIKAENAGKHGFKRTEFSRIQSATISHLTRSKVSSGDLLMVFVGAGTGNVARVPDDQEYFLGPNIAMIRIESKMVLPAYLEIFLRSSLGSELTLGFMKAVAQPSLSMGTIRQISIAIPAVKEQITIFDEIDRRLSVSEELETAIETNLKRAERLRQVVLKEAFSGPLC